MNHPAGEQLLDVYYGDAPPEIHSETQAHLQRCEECRLYLDQLKATLDGFGAYEVPERGEAYGVEVWSRIAAKLPSSKQRSGVFRAGVLAPAMAALLVIAFLGGVWAEHQWSKDRQAVAAPRTQERVLLFAMSDHLERAQIVLTELAHADPDLRDLSAQRERARHLVEQNRLLRQTATRLGDFSQAALLDDLGRVLLSVANSSPEFSSEELRGLQERIEQDRLQWKLKITSTSSRERGEKL